MIFWAKSEYPLLQNVQCMANLPEGPPAEPRRDVIPPSAWFMGLSSEDNPNFFDHQPGDIIAN